MADRSEAFIGIDTSKLRKAVAVAEAGRNGEVRFLGEIANSSPAEHHSPFNHAPGRFGLKGATN